MSITLSLLQIHKGGREWYDGAGGGAGQWQSGGHQWTHQPGANIKAGRDQGP